MASGHVDYDQSGAYITVGVDQRGSACWRVVLPDQVIECLTGDRAMTIMRALAASRGITGLR